MTDTTTLREQVMEVLHTVNDPEVPVDIVDFGLIYGVDVQDNGNVEVTMSLTSPSCPAAKEIPTECETKLQALEGTGEVTIHIVWDPPWTPEMISPEGRKKLGME